MARYTIAERDRREHQRADRNHGPVGRPDSVHERRHSLLDDERAQPARNHRRADGDRCFLEDQAHDVGRLRAETAPNGDLVGAGRHAQSRHAVDARQAEKERDDSQHAEEPRVEIRLTDRARHQLGHVGDGRG